MSEALNEEISRRGGPTNVVKKSTSPRTLDYEFAEDLPEGETEFDDELVERTIGQGTMSVIYGASNSGKTFVAIDLGASICRGVTWIGRNVVKGLVFYLATEAAASVRRRLCAYQKHHDVRVQGFVVVKSPINLFDNMADTEAVIALVREIERQRCEKVVLIIGDTLARISSGANENSGQDMSVVLANADAIRDATGATFLWIHHCGKDQAKGMRGWSGMQAAIDTEIEVTASELTGLRVAEITKQRDLHGKGERIGFRLEPVPLGQNRWGAPRGSMVVVATDAAAKVKPKRRSEVAGAIEEYLRQLGCGCKRAVVVKHFEGKYVRASVYREINKMRDAGELNASNDIVALPGVPAIAP